MATVNSGPGRGSVVMGSALGKSRLARWAVGLATAVLVVLGVSYAVFGVAYAFGGSGAISDTFVGFLAGFALIVGLLTSLAAFVLAIATRVKGERWALLWLPLSVFPVLLAIVIVVETFWMR